MYDLKKQSQNRRTASNGFAEPPTVSSQNTESRHTPTITNSNEQTETEPAEARESLNTSRYC
jgi:hypothetical protein